MVKLINPPRLLKKSLRQKAMSWVDPGKGGALVKPPEQPKKPEMDLLTNLIHRFLKEKGWGWTPETKSIDRPTFGHFRYMLSGLVQEFRGFLDKLRMYGIRVPYLTDEQIGMTLEQAINEAERQEFGKGLVGYETKGRKLRTGDRVAGHYVVPGLGESDFSGTIESMEADQGNPRGMPSSFGRAWVRLDKPMVLNPDAGQSGTRERLILTVSPTGEVQEDNYLQLKTIWYESKAVRAGTCKPGERADITGCTPRSQEDGPERQKKPGEQTGFKPAAERGGTTLEKKGANAAKKITGRLQQFEGFIKTAPLKVREKLYDLALSIFGRVNDAADAVLAKIPHGLHEDIKEAAQMNLLLQLEGKHGTGIHAGAHLHEDHGEGMAHAGLLELPEFHFEMHLENEWSLSTGGTVNWKLQLGAALGSYVLSRAVVSLCRKMGSPKVCFGYGKGKPSEHKSLDENSDKVEQSVDLSIALLDAMATAAKVKVPYSREAMIENAKEYLGGGTSEKYIGQKDIVKGTCKPGERADLTDCTPASRKEGESKEKVEEQPKEKPEAKPGEDMHELDKVDKVVREKAMANIKQIATGWLEKHKAMGRQLTPTELADFSKSLANDVSPEDLKALQARCVEGRCPKTKERYTLNVYSDKNVDAYLLRWGEGIPADWHDHGEGRDGAKVGIYVVDGEPENDLLTPKGKVVRQRLQPGHHYSLGAPYIHRMVDTGKPSWTVHSYSGPKGGLNHMNFYKRDADDNIILEGGKPVKINEWIADPEDANKPAPPPIIPEENPALGRKKDLDFYLRKALEKETPKAEYKVYKDKIILRKTGEEVSAWIEDKWDSGYEKNWEKAEHASAGDIADLTTDPEALDQFGIIGVVENGEVKPFASGKYLSRADLKKKVLTPETKTSYFSTCERDELGHCVDSGKGGSGVGTDSPAAEKPVTSSSEPRTVQLSKEPELNESLNQNNRYVRSMPDAEKKAVERYTGFGFSDLNAAMRSCPPDFSCLEGRDKMLAESLEKSIANAPPFEPVTAFRGISVKPELAAALEQVTKTAMENGDEFSMPSFTSTTVKPAHAFKFSGNTPVEGVASLMFEIKAKTGLYLKGVGTYDDDEETEHEILQSPRTRYKVTSVGDTIYNIGGKSLKKRVIALEEI